MSQATNPYKLTRPTRSLAAEATTGAPEPPEATQAPCLACGAVRSERERWTFTGRETHWNYTYLVWTRDDGKRFARWVE